MKNDVLSLYWIVYWGSLIDILAMNIFLPVTFFLRYINNVSTLGSCFTLTISLYATQAAIEFSVEPTLDSSLPWLLAYLTRAGIIDARPGSLLMNF